MITMGPTSLKPLDRKHHVLKTIVIIKKLRWNWEDNNGEQVPAEKEEVGSSANHDGDGQAVLRPRDAQQAERNGNLREHF